MTLEPSYLIVNADDYGYFDCVSRGILDSTQRGIVTAIGIFANSNQFNKHIDRLVEENTVDLGVHLNLTDQAPLTQEMQNRLSRWEGLFPDKFTIVRLVLTGTITAEIVKLEWKAQIDRCLEKELNVRFLNSHEHIHMLPPLFKVVQELAAEYAIPHIRLPTPELFQSLAVGALIRDGSMKLLEMLNRRRLRGPPLHFFGMGESGRLSIPYLKRKFSQLIPGQVYELMCHPGHYDADEVTNSKLLDYHDWQGEFETLTNPKVRDMLHEHSIKLIGYRHLDMKAANLIVRDEVKP